MNRLFRSNTQGSTGYIALALFVLAYAAVVALLIAPGAVTSAPHQITTLAD